MTLHDDMSISENNLSKSGEGGERFAGRNVPKSDKYEGNECKAAYGEGSKELARCGVRGVGGMK